MLPPRIHHVTLNTGRCHHSTRDRISDQTFSQMASWLEQAISTGERLPLPDESICHYSAVAKVVGGCLVVTVYAAARSFHPRRLVVDENARALLCLGVAETQADAEQLWLELSHQYATAWSATRSEGGEQPELPWSAVVQLPPISADFGVYQWLADFEHRAAWAWMALRSAVAAVQHAS